jgi:TPR repeat protein
MSKALFKFNLRYVTSHSKIVLSLILLSVFCLQPVMAENYEEGRKAYINGEYKKAFKILSSLAKDGDSEAQKMLGIMYDYGHGVKADSEKALSWYLRSAEQGHPAVQYQVGAKYFRGDGVKQNYPEAAKWWDMAANGGQVDAQFNLGLMYFRGLSISSNDEKAAKLFELAAAQGHAHGQYSLAVMYAFGRGVEKNYATALDWFHRSADQGVGQAQFNLGVFYENGYGVDKNINTARQWYQKAADQGTKEAEKKLANLDSPSTASNASVAADVEIAQSIDSDNEMNIGREYNSSDIAVDGMKREAWALSQSPDHYSLQIGSVTREDKIINFLKENDVTEKAAYIRVVIKGITRYNALYGVYSSYADATAAIENLPAKLRKVKPWVRSFRMIQQLLHQDDDN